MVFSFYVEVDFSRLSFETLWPTISWTIKAVSARSSLHNFWRHMQSKRWLP